MNNKERVSVFIDGSNFYHLVKKLFPNRKQGDFNFERFLKFIASRRNLASVYYYNCPLDRNKDNVAYRSQQKFFEKLRPIPNFNLILCRMQKVRINGKIIYQIKEDDIHLAVDMVRLSYEGAYDTAILVSSDGDFVPAINAVQKTGRRVENVGFEHKFSYHLKKVCDKFVKLKKEDLDEFFD